MRVIWAPKKKIQNMILDDGDVNKIGANNRTNNHSQIKMAMILEFGFEFATMLIVFVKKRHLLLY